jgi:1-acyl-sn-glycerol-3-phosphate acyltransferase
MNRTHHDAPALGRGGLSFLVKEPTRPDTLESKAPKHKLGIDYDTTWARRYGVRLARAMVLDDLSRPFLHAALSPHVIGAEHLDPIEGPVILAANHASHFDTALLESVLPSSRRHHTVVAAASDYFFNRQWKAAVWSFLLGAIPMERSKVNRRSADLAARLIEDGWNLIIFPEGGRTTDGWGQEFKGGASYLAKRCEVPVIPVHIKGTRAVLAKGSSHFRPRSTQVRIGKALFPSPKEDARKFAARIEQAVASLADEAETDWWSARKRAAQGNTLPFRGPQVSTWRRDWALPESARKNQRLKLADYWNPKPWEKDN